MILTLLLVFGLRISKSDLRTHTIRNRDLIYFMTATALFSFRDIGRFSRLTVTTFVLSLILSLVTGIGMGDVKLLSVLIPLLGSSHRLDLISLLLCICSTSLVAAVISIVKSRKISLPIPWAPSLFAASILYLATQ